MVTRPILQYTGRLHLRQVQREHIMRIFIQAMGLSMEITPFE
jgi:hypothetical protein